LLQVGIFNSDLGATKLTELKLFMEKTKKGGQKQGERGETTKGWV